MIQAYTTTAVINYSMGAPEEPMQPTSFMPNYRLYQPKTTASKPVRRYTDDEIIDWQARVASLAAEMKRGGGPMLDEIKAKSNG